MNVKQLIGAITGMLVKFVIVVIVILVVFKGAVMAYNFGFQVFADAPMSEGEGRTVNVVISEKQTISDVSQMLETKGLVKDAKVFLVQAKLTISGEDQTLQPGSYELNTAMRAEDMIKLIYSEESVTTEENE